MSEVSHSIDASEFIDVAFAIGNTVKAQMPDLKAYPETGVYFAAQRAERRVTIGTAVVNLLSSVRFLAPTDPTREALEPALVEAISTLAAAPVTTVDCSALKGSEGKKVYDMLVGWTQGEGLKGTAKAIEFGTQLAAKKYELVNFSK